MFPSMMLSSKIVTQGDIPFTSCFHPVLPHPALALEPQRGAPTRPSQPRILIQIVLDLPFLAASPDIAGPNLSWCSLGICGAAHTTS